MRTDHQYHLLQPLFRALIIAIDSRNYSDEDSKLVGRISVFRVRTGIEEGRMLLERALPEMSSFAATQLALERALGPGRRGIWARLLAQTLQALAHERPVILYSAPT